MEETDSNKDIGWDIPSLYFFFMFLRKYKYI
nr:MAG TPA: hypothetical protein [Caudoviricetes sp.]